MTLRSAIDAIEKEIALNMIQIENRAEPEISRFIGPLKYHLSVVNQRIIGARICLQEVLDNEQSKRLELAKRDRAKRKRRNGKT